MLTTPTQVGSKLAADLFISCPDASSTKMLGRRTIIFVLSLGFLMGASCRSDSASTNPQRVNVTMAGRAVTPTTLPTIDGESVSEFGTWYASAKDHRAAIGYAPSNGVFYRWRGITIPFEWVWHPGQISGPGFYTHDDMKNVIIVDVDPPVDYLLAPDGFAEPGYFDRGLHYFYRWKGVRFDPKKVPHEWLGVVRDPEEESLPIRDIEVPEHLRSFADRLNITAQGEK